MSIAHRLRLTLAVLCPIAARTPISAQEAQGLLEQVELSQEWIPMVPWVGAALLLLLVILAAWHREPPLEHARWVGETLRWCHARRTVRVRLAWLDEAAAPLADLERQMPVPPSARRGPPTPGVGKQFLVMLFAHLAVFAIAIASQATKAALSGRGLTLVALLGLAVAGAVVASVVSAVSLAALPRSLAGVAILCGALTLAFAAHALPLPADRVLPTIAVATLLSAVLIGGVGQVSGRPLRLRTAMSDVLGTRVTAR